MASNSSALIEQNRAVEPTGFEATGESLASRAKSEVEARVLIAKRFPRDEDTAYQKIAHACAHPKFAKNARYAYKQGMKKDDKGRWVPNIVSGPTIKLIKSIAAYWGNMEWGHFIVGQNEEGALIRAFAWDLETNVRTEREHFVARLVDRKIDGETKQVKPAERAWRETIGNMGSRLARTMVERVIPDHIVQDAQDRCLDTLAKQDSEDPDAVLKKILVSFDELRVPASELERFLGHKPAECSPSELQTLREIVVALTNGDSKWSDFAPSEEPERGSIDPSKLKPSSDPNRGHDGVKPEKKSWLEMFKDAHARLVEVVGEDRTITEAEKILEVLGIKDLRKARDEKKLTTAYNQLTARRIELQKERRVAGDGGPQPGMSENGKQGMEGFTA